MTEQEQIEQMARITCQMYCRQYEKRCAGVGECDYKCLHYQRCEVLYAAGYHKQSEWISVKDRLPEQFGKYLVGCKGIDIAQIRLYEGTWDSLAEVTHWMPLPTPPAEKEN